MYHIRYANCWEDAETVLASLNVEKGGKYCAIASAGDIALALLSREPDSVTARDMNPAQCALLELRAAAIACGSHDEVLRFIGVRPARARREFYLHLRERLTGPARSFWDARIRVIRRGIIHAGRVERYFRFFRRVFLPLLLNGKRIAALRRSRANGDTRRRVDGYLDSPEWIFFIRLFFQSRLLRRLDLGRNAQTYCRVRYDPRDMIKPRLKRALENLAEGGNHFLDYIITGTFQHLPYYLRPEIFPVVKKNLAALRIQNGEIRSLLSLDAGRFYDGIYFSDVFEYMDETEYAQTLEFAARRTRPGGRIAYWNNLIDRGTVSPSREFLVLNDLARDLYLRRQAFFYGSLTVMQRR